MKFSTISTVVITASGLLACGPASPPAPERVGNVTQAWGSAPPSSGIIDAAEDAEELPPELAYLVETSTQIAKIMGNVNTGITVATKALEILGFVQAAQDVQQQRFDALTQKLNSIGVALSTQLLISQREKRISDMRSYVNDIKGFADRSGNGTINENLLSYSERTVLGNARSFSQTVAQDAGNPYAFKRYDADHVTDGEWKTYISARPTVESGLVFDWRLGVTELVQLINSRLSIIGVTQPDFRNTQERSTELGNYRDALQALYDKINGGIRCGAHKADSLMVICADIYTGISKKSTVYEPHCGSNYSASVCQSRVDAQSALTTQALMMNLPLFELRALIDALSVLLTGAPDVTASTLGGNGLSGIHLRGSGQNSCLAQFHAFTSEDPNDPFNPIVDNSRWLAYVQPCNGGEDQRWSFDRPSGNIRNASGACLTPSSFEPGTSFVAQPCSGSPGERWTYDPISGVFENAYHTVLTGPPAPWLSTVPTSERRGAGSLEAWDDTREQYNLGYWNWGTTYVSSDPYGRGGDVAIDGDTNGDWNHGSVTHTTAGLNQWGGGQYWFVDLHQPFWIGQIGLWNRTDCCWGRLSHFQILAWDTTIGDWRRVADRSQLVVTDPGPITIPVSVTTQYLMVQKTDAEILSLAEVVLLGY